MSKGLDLGHIADKQQSWKLESRAKGGEEVSKTKRIAQVMCVGGSMQKAGQDL